MDRINALDRYSSEAEMANPFNYEGCPESYRQQVLKPFAKRLTTRKDPIVLDLAGGRGESSSYLRQYDIKTVLFDLSRESLYPDPEMKIQGSIGKLPFRNESFDGIHFKDALVHSSNHNVLFAELFRILKPKSELLLTTTETGHILPFGFIISKITGKQKTKFFLSEKQYIKQLEGIVKKGRMDDYEVGPPYYPVKKLFLDSEIKKAGFKILTITNWKPGYSENDWYFREPTQRLVYTVIKP